MSGCCNVQKTKVVNENITNSGTVERGVVVCSQSDDYVTLHEHEPFVLQKDPSQALDKENEAQIFKYICDCNFCFSMLFELDTY